MEPGPENGYTEDFFEAMGKSMKEDIEKIYEGARPLGRLCRGFGKILYQIHAAPTYSRKKRDWKDPLHTTPDGPECRPEEDAGAILGVSVAGGNYAYAALNRPELLALPLITNAASWVYEKGREAYQETQE